MFSTITIMSFLTPLLVLAIIVALFIAGRIGLIGLSYRHSSYGPVSGLSFWQMMRSVGNYGEFLTFKKLEKLGSDHKLLTNVYLPKTDGSTTELDLVMLNQTGIYVFESKNYSGWIFGDEKSKNWTQTMKTGKKTKFMNPILQNKGHIHALLKLLPEIPKNLFYSYTIFSEHCELKNVVIDSENIKVLKRDALRRELMSDISTRQNTLTAEQVNASYYLLNQYSKVDESIKARHIELLKNNHQ